MLQILILIFCELSIFAAEEVSELPKHFLDYAKGVDVFSWLVGIQKEVARESGIRFKEFEISKIVMMNWIGWRFQTSTQFFVTGIVGFICTRKPMFVAIWVDMDALALVFGFICIIVVFRLKLGWNED